jgi:probable H4MPT-linked C1 transfer pathway protein
MTRSETLKQTLALDIGGANIKACFADRDGQFHAFSRHFLLTRNVAGLTDALADVVKQCQQQPAQWRVTMTGELCDCFKDRKQGVNAILDVVLKIAGDRSVLIWSTDGCFIDLPQARFNPLAVASANWHALATCLGKRYPSQRMMLVDTGSTTTDIIPIIHGQVASQGKTDAERLAWRELVYLGGSLTPLMALSGQVGGRLMNEFFATMHDLAVVIGAYPQDLNCYDSPDGMPYDMTSCLRRILRMFGDDLQDEWRFEDCTKMIDVLLVAAIELLKSAFNSVVGVHQPIDAVLISGSGSWLPLRMLKSLGNPYQVLSLESMWDDAMSACACARALMELDAGALEK